VQGLADVKRLLDLNRLADVAIAERDTDGTDGYASTVDWTNEVRPQVVLDLIAEVLRLRGAIRKADDFLNVVGDPIAAHITLHEAIAEPRGGRFGGDWAEPKPWDDPDVQAWLLRLTNHAGAPAEVRDAALVLHDWVKPTTDGPAKAKRIDWSNVVVDEGDEAP
jgi:hypothetical protein